MSHAPRLQARLTQVKREKRWAELRNPPTERAGDLPELRIGDPGIEAVEFRCA